MSYVDFCFETYKSYYLEQYAISKLKNADEKRRHSQKFSIRKTSIEAIKKFPEIEPNEIWKNIYIAHVNNVSGITDQKIIDSVISADNSWKKSSGHAFEEMVVELANISLKPHNLKLILQKDLSIALKLGNVRNEVRDISWLKEQIKSSIFDLYLAIDEEDGIQICGCIQTKTSIRDRVTRDREPSINAMHAFFLSYAVVMDGSFLKLPKFINMVNGNSKEFELNGWHALYVLSNDKKIEIDRIKCIDISMDQFTSDCVNGAAFWKKSRQWLNPKWRP